MLQLSRPRLEIHNLLLQPHDRGPFLLDEALILLRRRRIEAALGQTQVIAKRLGTGGVTRREQIGDERLVSVSTSSAACRDGGCPTKAEDVQLLGLTGRQDVAHCAGFSDRECAIDRRGGEAASGKWFRCSNPGIPICTSQATGSRR